MPVVVLSWEAHQAEGEFCLEGLGKVRKGRSLRGQPQGSRGREDANKGVGEET